MKYNSVCLSYQKNPEICRFIKLKCSDLRFPKRYINKYCLSGVTFTLVSALPPATELMQHNDILADPLSVVQGVKQ